MSSYPVSFLVGNPSLETLEIEHDAHSDAGVTPAGLRDEEPLGPALTWDDIDRMWVEEMERRDAEAAAAAAANAA